MGIIYILSVLALFAAFILIKKTEKKLNILSFIAMSIVTFLCYNAFVCYIYTFVMIPITLTSLSIINFVLVMIMVIIMSKTREIQMYKFDKTELIFIGIILIAVLIIAYLDFGFPFNIKYESGDPSTHYLTSVMFAEQDSLLTNVDDEIYGDLQGRKIASYVNSGILMKVFSNSVDDVDYYNIFIAFGIFILFMTGYMMFITLSEFVQNKKAKILALIISLLYIFGYPLNSLLFGFEYLSLGILILCAIIHMISYFENKDLKFGYILLIFGLLNFGVFCSYYMFVPFTYSALWIYFCIYYKKKTGKIITKDNVLILSITLLIPFALGYIYHLAPGIYNIFNVGAKEAWQNAKEYSSNILESSFSLYGYTYINKYSNIILLIPLTVCYIKRQIKEKNVFQCDIIMLAFLILFVVILYIANIFGKVSIYYIMKNYYALWLILFYMNFKELMVIFEKNKAMVYSIVFFYCILLILALIFVEVDVTNGTTGDNENITTVMDIYGANKTILLEHEIDYSTEEIEIIKYAKQKIDLENSTIEIFGNTEQLYWGYGFLRVVNYEDAFLFTMTGQPRLNYKYSNVLEKIGNVDYIIYFTDSTYYKEHGEELFTDNCKVIYQTSSGGIIKYE